MKKQLITFLAISTIVATGFAAPKKDKKAAADATEQTLKLDAAASSIEWKGTKKVGSFHVGGIKVKEGEIVVAGDNIKSGQVVVDMKTITNTDLTDADYNKKLVTHLSNADFFNVDKYPTSTFKLSSINAGKNKGEFSVKGELTMIGQTNPVEFPAKIKIENGQAMAEGVLKIDRTKWGLKYGSGNFFKELAGDKIINDEFELTLKLVAKK
ncbi:MAG: YceI family protein [Pseudobdellovibrio sp.]